MRSRNTLLRRAAIASASAIALSGAVAPSAWAAAEPLSPDSDDWGTIASGNYCSQATGWITRVSGLGRSVNAAVFPAHSPSLTDEPESQTSNAGVSVSLAIPPVTSLGTASALAVRTMRDKVSTVGSTATADVPCGAYAQAGAASLDVGLPYVAPVLPGGVQLSLLGVHLDGVISSATSRPGQPVQLATTLTAGYISSFGVKLVDLPRTGANVGLRIPPNTAQAAIAMAVVNEQVTTSAQGVPTTDASGNYAASATSASGYVNSVHVSLLGSTLVDATVGHAAVLGSDAAVPPLCTSGSRCDISIVSQKDIDAAAGQELDVPAELHPGNRPGR